MISKISSSTFSSAANKTLTKVGDAINNSKTAQKVVKYMDPNGFNNSFTGLMGLMLTMVILPRVATAAKRNPDDKEATKDEIAEILFRDVQTCLVILFALKILNSLISTKVGKSCGLPMTNKPFKKVFDTDSKGIKGLKEKGMEFAKNPKEKLKTIGKNFLDLVHPTGGVIALNDSEFVSKYSNMNSFDEITKMFESMKAQGGNPEKVFKNTVVKDFLNTSTKVLDDLKIKEKLGMDCTKDIKTVNETIKQLNKFMEQENSVQYFKENIGKMDKNIQKMFLEYFKDSKNMLVTNGRRLSAGLRTAALAIESVYLGFGLPALNQKRLEKKYLSDNPETKQLNEISNEHRNTTANLKLNSDEAKLFKDFIV